jgi:putative nucleotidyltransferase with HDIG domain
MRLFRSITLMLVLLTAVPILVVGVILIDSSVSSIKTMTWELQQEHTQNTSRLMEMFFESTLSDIELLASNVSLSGLNLRQRQDFLSFILQKQPGVNIVGFYDREGRPLPNLLAYDSAHILPSELSDHLSRAAQLFQAPLEKGLARFSEPYLIRRQARPELSLAGREELATAVALSLDTPELAALVMELSLHRLQAFMEQMKISEGGRALLISSEGRAVFHRSAGAPASPGGDAEQRLGRFLFQQLQAGGEGRPRVAGVRPLRLPDGSEVLAAYSPVGMSGLQLVSLSPLKQAYRATQRMTLQVVTVVLVSLLAALIIGVVFAFGITRPIGKCVTGALSIARGNFGTTLDVDTRNEIGELAHTFNYMSRQLEYYDQENKNLVLSLQRGYLETIKALANSIDAKDPYTRGHSMRVTSVALAIGRRLGLSAEEINILRYGGILHDIGKIGIKEEVLSKRERLTEEERQLLRNHPVLGEKIIEPIDFLVPVRPLIRHHHEWYDGSGYPDGLKEDQIPLGARIISAADTYDAVTSDRPYQKAVDNHQAMAILQGLRGRQLDPRICDTLIAVLEERIKKGELDSSQWDDELTDPSA